VNTEDYAIDDPYRYEELGRHMDNRVFVGSTKLITSLLALMNVLTAAAIVGGIIMYGRVTSLDDKVTLIIEGRIKIPGVEAHL
jgi:hypothetical protein